MLGKVILHNHWGFLSVEHELGRYYRRLFFNTYGLKLQRPSNEEHITIISPWDNLLLSNFHCFNGMLVKFEVVHPLYWNGNAIWLGVISEQLSDFRKSLGLSDPEIDLHFCIGYLNRNED